MGLPSLVTQTEVSPLVEQHADVLVGQLVAKAVFVGIVDPFCDPDKGFGPGQTGWVS